MNVKKALLLSLLISKMCLSDVYADAPVYEKVSSELYEQLETMDQPVGYFKSTNKYPYYWVYNPATNCLRQILCGSYDKELEGNIEIKKPEQLASISPLRFSVMALDQSTLEDVRYQGYRDTMLGQVVEQLLKTIKVIPDRHFKGRLFVDEYQEAIPQKWVFANAQEFGSLRKYIQANFNLHAIEPLAVKPILALEILKGSNNLTKHDVRFLNKYFTLAHPNDKKVTSFFKKNEKFATKAMSLVNPFNKKKIVIKQTFAEKQFHKFEDMAKKFSLEEACAVGALSVLGYVYKDHIMSWIMSQIDPKKKDDAPQNPVRNVLNPDDNAPKKEKTFFQELKSNSGLIIGGTISAVVVAAIINYWYQSIHEKAEELPAVAYGDEIDDNDIEISCNEEVINEVTEIDELEEDLAAEFIANRE